MLSVYEIRTRYYFIRINLMKKNIFCNARKTKPYGFTCPKKKMRKKAVLKSTILDEYNRILSGKSACSISSANSRAITILHQNSKRIRCAAGLSGRIPILYASRQHFNPGEGVTSNPFPSSIRLHRFFNHD
jgi:hypothetical protein